MKQVKKAVYIYDNMYKNEDRKPIAIWIFDNSTLHGVYAPNALRSINMVKKDGGKNQKPMRDGWFINSEGIRVIQCMQKNDANKTTKGMETVLKERGIVTIQPDFQEQKPEIVEYIESCGHRVLMLPKFHCELNYIEMIWGHLKRNVRSKVDIGTYKELSANLKEEIVKIPLSLIRKYARLSYRFMSVYRNSGDMNITAASAPFIVKKYKSHRTVSLRMIEEALEEYNALNKAKMEELKKKK